MPGRYLVDIDLTSQTANDRPQLPYPTDGHLIIEIGAREPRRLEVVCANLERQAMGPEPAASAAVETLSLVNDPVAVPYIARLLRARERVVSVLLGEALGRIGNALAVDTLMAYANSSWEDTRDAVRLALDSIARSTTDTSIRLRIEAWQK